MGAGGEGFATYLQYERIEEVDVGERANQRLNDQLRNHLTHANSTAHEGRSFKFKPHRARPTPPAHANPRAGRARRSDRAVSKRGLSASRNERSQ